jgi:hypothetical protein
VNEEEYLELRESLRELASCVITLFGEQLKLTAAVRANNRMLLLKNIATKDEMREAMVEAQQLLDENITEAIRQVRKIEDLMSRPGGTGKPN